MILLLAVLGAAADVPRVTFTLGQDASHWSLGDETFSQGGDHALLSDRSGAREALGVRGYAAAPKVPKELASELVAGPVCRVVVSAGAVEVTGCSDALAAVTREAVGKWKWEGSDVRAFDLVYGLQDAWRIGDVCFVPFRLFGSGTPVLDDSGVAGCSAVPRSELRVPAHPSGAVSLRCSVTLVATTEGPQNVVVDGCAEPYAGIVAQSVAEWRVKPRGGEPTPYTLRLDLFLPAGN